MTNEKQSDEKTVLEGEQALKLWREGKDEWNQWVEENPVADIDFSGVDFGKDPKNQIPKNNFEGFKFPKGKVDFSRVTFYQLDASQNEQNVSFMNAHFGDGEVTFENAEFGYGGINFTMVKFGRGSVNFSNAHFGKGEVDFSYAEFGEGGVYFCDALFDEGGVNFASAKFGEGLVEFCDAQFGGSYVFFGSTQFDCKYVSFTRVIFNGHATFSSIDVSHQVERLSFEAANFEKSLDLSDSDFPFVVDLTSTKITNHVSLEGLDCQPRFVQYKRFFQVAQDKHDIGRVQRLKEIAENNKDHERALEFNALEMRAKRFHENTAFWSLLLDYLYDYLSDYGRSAWKPFWALICSWGLFAIAYFAMSNNGLIDTCRKLGAALSFSGSQIVPIAPNSKTVQLQNLQLLFFGKMDLWLYLTTLLQSLISIIFLFLIGLAWRNRFRI